jgi:hypothetical protein
VTIRGYIGNDWMGMSVNITLVLEDSAFGDRRIIRFIPPEEGRPSYWGRGYDPVPDGGESVPPTLRLSMEEALAVEQALAEVRQGNSEYRALRADYDAERKRVDSMIGTISDIAIERALRGSS